MRVSAECHFIIIFLLQHEDHLLSDSEEEHGEDILLTVEEYGLWH